MYYSFFWGRSIRNILIERHCFYVALKQIANIYFYRRKKSWLLSLFLSSSTILNWLWISFLAIQQSCNLSSTLSYKRKKKTELWKKTEKYCFDRICQVTYIFLRFEKIVVTAYHQTSSFKHKKKLSSQCLW